MSPALTAAEVIVRNWCPGFARSYTWHPCAGPADTPTAFRAELDGGFFVIERRVQGMVRRQPLWVAELRDQHHAVIDEVRSMEPDGIVAQAFDVALAEWSAQVEAVTVR